MFPATQINDRGGTTRIAAIVISATSLCVAGCAGEMTSSSWDVPTLESVDPGRWAVLADRHVFFGHQSVGDNLMDGVTELLRKRPEIALRVTATADADSMHSPGLYHARIGTNGAPLTKLDAFVSVVSHDAFAKSAIALVKYCYIDVTPEFDPVALFESYRQTVESLKKAHPELTLVHVTMPLTTDSGWLRHVVATARGRFPVRQRNYLREVYNDLLRSTYAGREPIFDLARSEAVGPDGKARVVEYKGRHVPSLAEEWTDDGGHLNEAGRRRMAEAFLATLATI